MPLSSMSVAESTWFKVLLLRFSPWEDTDDDDIVAVNGWMNIWAVLLKTAPSRLEKEWIGSYVFKLLKGASTSWR